ncbi:hypothetical protein EJ08DRAFT_199513 [Tothia fuscella]|uniref:Uncharacterized protein n=1 Tax=Tothia fuscella TaxID=1048955 RepID=A0A9P4NTI6_9PEZI|nr:hypothetical protein EJ08DRAFT_199513 [Tothia fuscella]
MHDPMPLGHKIKLKKLESAAKRDLRTITVLIYLSFSLAVFERQTVFIGIVVMLLAMVHIPRVKLLFTYTPMPSEQSPPPSIRLPSKRSQGQRNRLIKKVNSYVHRICTFWYQRFVLYNLKPIQ